MLNERPEESPTSAKRNKKHKEQKYKDRHREQKKHKHHKHHKHHKQKCVCLSRPRWECSCILHVIIHSSFLIGYRPACIFIAHNHGTKCTLTSTTPTTPPQAAVDMRCYNVSITFCEHMVLGEGETLRSIAPSYTLPWRTLWWLNPTVQYADQPLSPGTRVSVGRVYRVAANETMEYFVREFGSTWSHTLEENPEKVNYLRQNAGGPVGTNVVDLNYKDYQKRVTYEGVEYCIVSKMDSQRRY